MHGLITIDWADGSYAFRLTLAGIEEIEAKCDASIFEITVKLQSRKSRSKEILETLRIGLIGGGQSPADAMALVRKYGDERPLDENRDAALAVCLAGLMRVHSKELDKEPEKPEAAKENTNA